MIQVKVQKSVGGQVRAGELGKVRKEPTMTKNIQADYGWSSESKLKGRGDSILFHSKGRSKERFL